MEQPMIDNPLLQVQQHHGNASCMKTEDEKGKNSDDGLSRIELYRICHWEDIRRAGIQFVLALIFFTACWFLTTLSVLCYCLLCVVMSSLILRVVIFVHNHVSKGDQLPIESYLQNFNLHLDEETIRGSWFNLWNAYASSLENILAAKDLVRAPAAALVLWFAAHLTHHVPSPLVFLFAIAFPKSLVNKMKSISEKFENTRNIVEEKSKYFTGLRTNE